MAPLDLTQISSNWKILQGRLQATNKKSDPATTTSTSNGLKRKRLEADNTKNIHPDRLKKTRFSASDQKKKKTNPRKMGSYASKDAEPTRPNHSTLLKDHDLAPSDLNAAYGSSTSFPTDPKTTALDDASNTNIGLHPTNKAGKFLALDCEMVGTGPPPHLDDVLARVSVVNYHGQAIYDTYVQPPPGTVVKDYRTHVSGIRPQNLRSDVARPFTEVQATVAKLLDGRVLVGHALKKDMLALQLTHAAKDVRDTSRYAAFRVESKGKPPALRNLARSQLGLVIQKGEHSSLEDARTTMGLFRKEKQGFEEENRRMFGNSSRRLAGRKGDKEVVKKDGRQVETKEEDDEEQDEEEDEDEDDLDLLDGEEIEGIDSDVENTTGNGAAGKPKKKHKKKKRTKRK